MQISRHSLRPPLHELLGADWQSIRVLNQVDLSDAKAAECCPHLGSGPSYLSSFTGESNNLPAELTLHLGIHCTQVKHSLLVKDAGPLPWTHFSLFLDGSKVYLQLWFLYSTVPEMFGPLY